MTEEEIATLRARVQDLEAALRQNDHSLALAFDLPPKLSDLLGLLMSVSVATSETIRQRLEITTDTKVSIHRLRKHMAPYGVIIHNRRGFGYWLDDRTKEGILLQLTPEVTDEVVDVDASLCPAVVGAEARPEVA